MKGKLTEKFIIWPLAGKLAKILKIIKKLNKKLLKTMKIHSNLRKCRKIN